MIAKKQLTTKEHCRHCKAPGKSILQGPPLLKKYQQKNFYIETEQYNIKHYYDQEKKDGLPKEWKPKTSSKSVMKSLSRSSKVWENPLVQSWSGNTFMTEHENRYIEKKYQKGMMESKVDRKIWRSLNQEIKKQHMFEKAATAGPEWFQEMSPAQMKLVDNFEPLLKQDYNERHSGRTQEFLYDLGVWPEVAPNHVARSVQRSEGNVISFIFNIHLEVIAMETPEYEKKFAEAKRLKMNISIFSINERILLTAVFHYHFPTLLKKLDQLLPPPYEEPTVLLGKKPRKNKKKYSSPYLEPLPINDKPWYEEREEKELERKVLLKVKRTKEKRDRREYRELVEEMRKLQGMCHELKKNKETIAKLTASAKSKSVESRNRAFTVFDEEDLACLSVLPPRERKSFFFKKYSEHVCNFIDAHNDYEECEEQQSPEERTSRQSSEDKRTGSTEWESVVTMDPMVTSCKIQEDLESVPCSDLSLNLLQRYDRGRDVRQIDQLKIRQFSLYDEQFCNKDSPYITRCLLDLEAENISEEINVIKVPSMESPKSSLEEEVDEYNRKVSGLVPLDISYKELTSVNRTVGLAEDREWEQMSGPPLPDAKSMTLAVAKPPQSKVPGKEYMMKKPYTVECPEPECGIVENLDEPLSEFELAKRRIATLPAKKQLKAAIKFLSDKGDPLAVLPKMEEVPWLARWFDKRRGIMRTLNAKDKAELLKRSQNIWNSNYTRPTEAPMVEIPEGNFNWNQKKKLAKTVKKRVEEHQRAVKHILIDNARDLFPSMFSEYFSGSRLAKSFRNTFYAYFPARERDCLVVRPWDPNGDSKRKEL